MISWMIHIPPEKVGFISLTQSNWHIVEVGLLCVLGLCVVPCIAQLLIQLSHWWSSTEKPVIAYAAYTPTSSWSAISSLLSALFPGRGNGREDRLLAGVGQIVRGWCVCCVMWQHTASSVPGGVAAPELPGEKKKQLSMLRFVHISLNC